MRPILLGGRVRWGWQSWVSETTSFLARGVRWQEELDENVGSLAFDECARLDCARSVSGAASPNLCIQLRSAVFCRSQTCKAELFDKSAHLNCLQGLGASDCHTELSRR